MCTCIGKCGCNITSLTKGEKGDPGANGENNLITVSDSNGNSVSGVSEVVFLNKTITVANLGSGVASVANLPYKAEIKNYVDVLYNGTTAETTIPGFTYTTPNDGVTRNYLLMFRTDVFSNTTSVVIALRIRNVTTSAILAISTPGSPDSSGSGTYIGDSIHCYVSLAPNTPIAVTFQTAELAVALKYPHLIILEQ